MYVFVCTSVSCVCVHLCVFMCISVFVLVRVYVIVCMSVCMCFCVYVSGVCALCVCVHARVCVLVTIMYFQYHRYNCTRHTLLHLNIYKQPIRGAKEAEQSPASRRLVH